MGVEPLWAQAAKLLSLTLEVAVHGCSVNHRFIEHSAQHQMSSALMSRNKETKSLRVAGTYPRACSISSGRTRSPDSQPRTFYPDP